MGHSLLLQLRHHLHPPCVFPVCVWVKDFQTISYSLLDFQGFDKTCVLLLYDLLSNNIFTQISLSSGLDIKYKLLAARMHFMHITITRMYFHSQCLVSAHFQLF
jgi:hypothetical protein